MLCAVGVSAACCTFAERLVGRQEVGRWACCPVVSCWDDGGVGLALCTALGTWHACECF
jgi:hypothetical protein